MEEAVFSKSERPKIKSESLSLNDISVINSITQEAFGKDEDGSLLVPAIVISDGETSQRAFIQDIASKLEIFRDEKINLDSIQLKLDALSKDIKYKSVQVYFRFHQDKITVSIEVYASGDDVVKVRNWGRGVLSRLLEYIEKNNEDSIKGIVVEKTGKIVKIDDHEKQIVQQKIVNKQIINAENISNSNISHSGNISVQSEKKGKLEKVSWIAGIVSAIIAILVYAGYKISGN